MSVGISSQFDTSMSVDNFGIAKFSLNGDEILRIDTVTRFNDFLKIKRALELAYKQGCDDGSNRLKTSVYHVFRAYENNNA